MKKIFLLFLFFTLFSCKEKTYEELEAEVLCDVLPEVAKYELKNSINHLLPPPPPSPQGKNQHQEDSIYKIEKIKWENYFIENKKQINKTILKLDKFKEVTFGVLDTLYSIERLKSDEYRYEFDSLEVRGLNIKEFEKCNLKINLVNRENTFEGGDRNSDNPMLFLTRVLINKNKKVARFSVLKYFYSFEVVCSFSEEKQKWIIKEITKEDYI